MCVCVSVSSLRQYPEKAHEVLQVSAVQNDTVHGLMYRQQTLFVRVHQGWEGADRGISHSGMMDGFGSLNCKSKAWLGVGERE